jgi:uncharacterized repeat protein (TIGR03803 family)
MNKFSKNSPIGRGHKETSAAAARRILSALILVVFCAASANSSHAQAFTVLSNFDPDNWIPMYSLVQAPDGLLYGTTNRNGIAGSYGGTLFKFSLVDDTLSTLYAFCAESDCPGGIDSSGALVEDENGLFYGSAPGGGTYSIGTVFSVSSSRTLTTLYNFGSQANDGINPYSGLILANDDNFYGTTYNGGTHTYGTVFRISKEGVKSTIYNFCQLANCADGSAPYGPLIQAANGKLYGTTPYSGCKCGTPPPSGTLFEVTLGGQLTTLHTFCLEEGCPDGSGPLAGIIQSNDGTLYGTTYEGGAYNQGTVYKITPAGVFTTIYSFCNCGDGANPFGALVEATDRSIYGTTNLGGANDYGTVFAINPAGTLTTLHSFSNADGAYPEGGLLQATDGNLYGTTASGGDSACQYGGCGTLFRLSLGLSPFVHPLTSFGRAGQSIFILGTNLEGTTSVTFNGNVASFTVLSATSIRATVPSDATTGIIQVVTPGGTLNSNVPFTVMGAGPS